MEEILKIINEVGTNWKIKRALLRLNTDLSEESIKLLVPEDQPSDY